MSRDILLLRRHYLTDSDAWNDGRQYGATINTSGDEIANVNFLYDDIVHALKIQSTLA